MAGLFDFNENPVMNSVPVATGSKGTDAIADALGNVSHTAFAIAEDMYKDRSRENLSMASNHISDISTDANINLLKNPGQADKILNNYQSSVQALKQSSALNKEDQLSLDRFSNDSVNRLAESSAKVALKYGQVQASNNYWGNYTQSMQNIQQSFRSGDFKTAEMLSDAQHKHAFSAFTEGVITPQQYTNIVKQLGVMHDHQALVSSIVGDKNVEVDAADVHHINASLHKTGGDHKVAGLPHDENTGWLVNHHINDKTMSNQLENLYYGRPLDPAVISNQSDSALIGFSAQQQGHISVMSQFSANKNVAEMEYKMKSLTAKGNKLNQFEQGQLGTWNAIKDMLDKGQFLEAMSNTTLGQQNSLDFNFKQSALFQRRMQTEDQKEINDIDSQMTRNYNDFISNNVAIARGMHMDPGYINPFTAETVDNVKMNMSVNGDVSKVIGELARVDKNNLAYLPSQAFHDDPTRAAALYTSGLSIGNSEPGFTSDILLANSKGVNYETIIKKDPINITNNNRIESIWTDVQNDSDISDITEYQSKQGKGSDAFAAGFMKATANYMYFKGVTNNDYTLNNRDSYFTSLKSGLQKSYKIVKSDGYIFNATTMPSNLRDADFDHLSAYAKMETLRRMKEDGMSDAQIAITTELNPMTVTNTADGRIVVLNHDGKVYADQEGNELFDMAYSSDMLHAAYDVKEKYKNNMEPLIGGVINPFLFAEMHYFLHGENK